MPQHTLVVESHVALRTPSRKLSPEGRRDSHTELIAARQQPPGEVDGIADNLDSSVRSTNMCHRPVVAADTQRNPLPHRPVPEPFDEVDGGGLPGRLPEDDVAAIAAGRPDDFSRGASGES